MGTLVRAHPLTAFLSLALSLSWLIEVPLALTAQGIATFPVPFSWHYLAAFGPLLAALLVTVTLDGGSGLRDLLGRMWRWRIGSGWLLVAVVSPIALFLAAALASRLTRGTWPDLGRLGEVNFLGDIGAPFALLLWIVSFGFGEETGWRGFALPRLQQQHSALVATLGVTAVWGLWHVPAFFYLPTYQVLGLAGIPPFAIGLLLGSILLTWLYNSTTGSIFAVSMWHALYDFFSAAHATDVFMNGLMATVVMLWAIGVLVLAGPARLSRSDKATAPGPAATSIAHKRTAP